MSKYMVCRVFRDWNKPIQILYKEITLEKAQSIVQNSPREKDSMVVFEKMK